jgi:hypothetical protein
MSRDTCERCPELRHHRLHNLGRDQHFLGLAWASAASRALQERTNSRSVCLHGTGCRPAHGLVASLASPAKHGCSHDRDDVESAAQLSGWLAYQGITDVDAVTRDHVAEFITRLIETRSPSTASVRFRSLQQFFGWLAEEGELAGTNTMKKMRPPVVTPDQLRKLFASCSGKSFIDGATRRFCASRRHRAAVVGAGPPATQPNALPSTTCAPATGRPQSASRPPPAASASPPTAPRPWRRCQRLGRRHRRRP